jgi:thiol-disulfide isomerase/thioredoxin
MARENIIEITDATWERIVEKAEKPVIVMFYSLTCPHCQEMEPYFIQYAEEFHKKLIFTKLNIITSPGIVAKYGIMGTPTFKFLCKGNPVNELVGTIYPHILKKSIENVLEYGPNCIKNSTRIDYNITGYG